MTNVGTYDSGATDQHAHLPCITSRTNDSRLSVCVDDSQVRAVSSASISRRRFQRKERLLLLASQLFTCSWISTVSFLPNPIIAKRWFQLLLCQRCICAVIVFNSTIYASKLAAAWHSPSCARIVPSTPATALRCSSKVHSNRGSL